MVLAGPGSGKTLVITKRIQYLIEINQVKPEEILVITFTKAAALEMRERFLRLMGRNVRVAFGTFHAIFFQILKYAYHYSADNILREDQRYQILQELSEHYRLEYEDQKELIGDLAAEIAKVKNEQIALEHFYSGVCSSETFRQIYRKYEEELQRRKLIDFDDMLVYTRDLFAQREDILHQWQARFSYVLVDEFQDINGLQYEILKMLTHPHNNLFAVGDDDQSIYRFRGAKPEIMLGFQKDFPQAKIMQLHENYRSVKPIVDAAGEVIAENKMRYPKKITCVRGDGAKVEIRRLNRAETEALYLVKQLRAAKESGTDWKQMAILTRTTAGGRYIAEKLLEFGIPFAMTGSVPNIYEHWIAEDLWAYIRLGMGARERRDFLRVMNHPTRYISRECVDLPQVDFERLRMYYEDKPWMVKRLDALEEDLHLIGRMRPYAAINYIRSGMQYDQFLTEYAEMRRMQKDDLLDVVEQLQERARAFASFREWFAHIEEYKRQLDEQKRRPKDGEMEDAVALQTMHGSKGLEYEEVFIPDLNEGIVPHKKAALEADIEEERRLLYVGMTRAKNRLHLYYLKERYGREAEPSRFLEVFDLEE